MKFFCYFCSSYYFRRRSLNKVCSCFIWLNVTSIFFAFAICHCTTFYKVMFLVTFKENMIIEDETFLCESLPNQLTKTTCTVQFLGCCLLHAVVLDCPPMPPSLVFPAHLKTVPATSATPLYMVIFSAPSANAGRAWSDAGQERPLGSNSSRSRSYAELPRARPRRGISEVMSEREIKFYGFDNSTKNKIVSVNSKFTAVFDFFVSVARVFHVGHSYLACFLETSNHFAFNFYFTDFLPCHNGSIKNSEKSRIVCGITFTCSFS